jgi:hypothetical protein
MFLGFWESHFSFLLEGSFHLPFMEFILSHLDSNSFSSDEKLFEEIAIDDKIAMRMTITYVNTWEYFTSFESNEKQDILITM